MLDFCSIFFITMNLLVCYSLLFFLKKPFYIKEFLDPRLRGDGEGESKDLKYYLYIYYRTRSMSAPQARNFSSIRS